MECFNSHFVESTIRDDKGVNGAIFVDSILIREAELPYGQKTNLIPSQSIKDSEFLNSLKGLLIFKEHPKEMVNKDNYSSLASQSIGSIVNAEYRENDNGNGNIVYGTLRITNSAIIDDIKHKRINGGSLGYYANSTFENGKEVQVNLKPNHFCLTHSPRDSGVKIFNSNQSKGVTMEKQEIVEIVNSLLNAKAKNEDTISIPKEKFNSFMQTIESRIKDTEVKAICNSKNALDKMVFLDNMLSVKDVFNSEEKLAREEGKAEAQAKDIDKDKKELEGYKAEIEELKKENSLLSEKLKKLNSDCDDKPKANEADDKKDDKPKEDEKDEKKNEDDEGKKDDKPKANEADEGDEKKNSNVPIKSPQAVKNSIDSHYAEVASQLNF